MANTRAGRKPDKHSRPLPNSGKVYFLGIGIDVYQHWPSLNNAVRDVKSVSELLIEEYGLTKSHTLLLFNEEATREKIIHALEEMANQVESRDSLLVYYAGHGHLNKRQRGFWVPSEAPKSGLSHYIPNSTIRDYLGDIGSLHTLLISDACFSGSLFVRGERSAQLAAEELALLPSRWAICSGRHDEVVADGPTDGHSPFAESILDVLGKTKRPYITTNLLFEQIRDQTRANYDQLPDGGPIQGVGHKRGQFIFERKQDENVAWAETQEAGDLTALTNFIGLFPNGKHQQEARDQITKLKAVAAWQTIRKLPTDTIKEIDRKRREIRQFYANFPQSEYYDEALKTGRDLEYKREYLSLYDSEFGLLGFVRKDTPYRDLARERLNELALKNADTASFPPEKPSPTSPSPTPASPPRTKPAPAGKGERPPVPRAVSSPPSTKSKERITKDEKKRNPPPADNKTRKILLWTGLGVAGVIVMIIAFRLINSGPSAAELARVENMEIWIAKALDNRDLSGAQRLRDKYASLPSELINNDQLTRLDKFIVAYQDSVDQLANQEKEDNSQIAQRQPPPPTPPSEKPDPSPTTTIPETEKPKAETEKPTTVDNSEVFNVVEEAPRFPGCEQLATKAEKQNCSNKKMLDYIYSSLKYPALARRNGVEGVVVLNFIVEKDGSLSQIKALRSPGAGCGEEAIRVMNSMNVQGIRWIPGKQRGRPVRVSYNIPIKFKLD